MSEFSQQIQTVKTTRDRLRTQVNRLDALSDDVRKDFVGVDSDQCAKLLDEVAQGYRQAIKELDQLEAYLRRFE